MQTMTDNGLMIALFNLGGGETILILALVLILIGVKKLPELARGLGEGLTAFRGATKDVLQTVDDEASEAGRSAGGIYGKPAAQALTPDNQVAELYSPEAFEKDRKSQRIQKSFRRFLKLLWRRSLQFVSSLRTPAR